MKHKSNADHLRELINSDSYSKEEALELVAAMEEDITDANANAEEMKSVAIDAEQERDDLQTQLDDRPILAKVFLGLDTMHYYLEAGNLKIRQQLEDFINEVKSQNGAGVLINHG